MSQIFENPGKESTVGPVDERPLTDEERRSVARLLSDPFSFPQQFKTWLVAFLEGSDLTLPLGSVSGLINLLGSGGEGGAGIFSLLPAGCLFPLGVAGPPTGTLLCNGTAHSRVDRKRLFDAIGTTWGAGDGTTTFNVPDLRDRALYGSGAAVGLAGSDGRAFGNRGGPLHHHAWGDVVNISISGSTSGGGGHGHNFQQAFPSFVSRNTGTGVAASRIDDITYSDRAVTGAGGHEHNFSGGGSDSVGGDTSGGADQDKPSFAGVLYVINY